MSEPVSTLVAQLAYRLGGCTVLARAAALPSLADVMLGLQGVLADAQLKLRPGDGRAIMHALRGFEAIFCDLQADAAAVEISELREAMASAQTAARQLADALERPPLFEGVVYGIKS